MRRHGTWGLLLVAAVVSYACGNGREATDETGGETAMADTMAPGGATPPDSGAADSVVPESEAPGAPVDDPFAGFELEAAPGATADSRRIALLLRNLGTRLAVVYADGGAGEVLLDSVAGGGEARVDIATRATSIMLRSMTPDGDTLRTEEIIAGPDTVLEVIVGGAAGAP